MEVGRNGDEDGREERVERKVKMREKVKSGNYVKMRWVVRFM